MSVLKLVNFSLTHFLKYSRYAGPYRGSKFSLLEGGIRIPAIISWPGTLPENEVRDQLAGNVDWLPTLAELCNIVLPTRKIDGKSIVQAIKSSNAPSPHNVFFWKSGGGSDPQWAVRKGNWKLVHNPQLGKFSEAETSENGVYLFNMLNDVGEKKNEAEKYPDVVMDLTKRYEAWINEVATQ
ncbi:MAG TPA: sulfatase/phosphatase domain-containing protein [Agriterribacter sp.]|nr:sulfatase/phosphatase domain-containing protein [Agriterribacter sp.]